MIEARIKLYKYYNDNTANFNNALNTFRKGIDDDKIDLQNEKVYLVMKNKFETYKEETKTKVNKEGDKEKVVVNPQMTTTDPNKIRIIRLIYALSDFAFNLAKNRSSIEIETYLFKKFFNEANIQRSALIQKVYKDEIDVNQQYLQQADKLLRKLEERTYLSPEEKELKMLLQQKQQLEDEYNSIGFTIPLDASTIDDITRRLNGITIVEVDQVKAQSLLDALTLIHSKIHQNELDVYQLQDLDEDVLKKEFYLFLPADSIVKLLDDVFAPINQIIAQAKKLVEQLQTAEDVLKKYDQKIDESLRNKCAKREQVVVEQIEVPASPPPATTPPLAVEPEAPATTSCPATSPEVPAPPTTSSPPVTPKKKTSPVATPPPVAPKETSKTQTPPPAEKQEAPAQPQTDPKPATEEENLHQLIERRQELKQEMENLPLLVPFDTAQFNELCQKIHTVTVEEQDMESKDNLTVILTMIQSAIEDNHLDMCKLGEAIFEALDINLYPFLQDPSITVLFAEVFNPIVQEKTQREQLVSQYSLLDDTISDRQAKAGVVEEKPLPSSPVEMRALSPVSKPKTPATPANPEQERVSRTPSPVKSKPDLVVDEPKTKQSDEDKPAQPKSFVDNVINFFSSGWAKVTHFFSGIYTSIKQFFGISS